jgi:ATP-dependent Clp protease, protease subunit
MKHPFQIQAQGTAAQVKLIGDITWWKNSGAEFTRLIDQLIEAGIKDLDLYGNSGGGDVLEANEIYNQLLRFTGRRRGKIGALCASAMTIVMLACDEVEMAPNGQYMIHDLCGYPEGSIKDIESYLGLMQNLTDHYVSTLAKKTGLPEKEITSMMNKTTWMSATTARDKKFITSITNEDADTDIYASIKNYGYKNVPVAVTNMIPSENQNQNQDSPNKIIMKNRIIAALGLPVDATEDQIAAAVEKLSKDQVTALAKLTDVENSTAKAKAKILIDNAIDQKKISEAEREQFTKDAVANYDVTERLLAKIAGVKKISAQEGAEGDSAEDAAAAQNGDRSKWTLKDWMEKDKEGMIKMRSEKWATYAKLYEAHYNRPCVKE